MNTERQLPEFIIEGTTFLVDIEKQELRQKDNPANRISFFNDITDAGDHYYLLYDRGLKNYPHEQIDPSQTVKVTIPQMTELDPEGMAAKHGFTSEAIKGKSDFEVIVDQELLAERMSGKLPQISIAGEDYIIDMRLKELRPADGFGSSIQLLNLELAPEEDRYLCYFHPVYRQVININPELCVLPKDLVQLEIPFLSKLDPVGMANEYGIKPRDMLKRYPIQKNLTAKVVPIAETGLAAFVQRNRQRAEQLGQQRHRQKRRIGPRQG